MMCLVCVCDLEVDEDATSKVKSGHATGLCLLGQKHAVEAAALRG